MAVCRGCRGPLVNKKGTRPDGVAAPTIAAGVRDKVQGLRRLTLHGIMSTLDLGKREAKASTRTCVRIPKTQSGWTRAVRSLEATCIHACARVDACSSVPLGNLGIGYCRFGIASLKQGNGDQDSRSTKGRTTVWAIVVDRIM